MKEGITIEAFTYLDYIKYKRILEEKNVQTVLRDQKEEYILEHVESKINQEHDKLIKQIFSNKKEAVKFINKNLGLEGTGKELQLNQIVECNTEFITDKMEKLQSDILYRIKNTTTFILVEHQSTEDYRMPIRIIKYCLSIVEDLEKREKINFRKEKFPTIYPIVFYTGKRRWKVKTDISEYQENVLGIETVSFTKYKLVDINEYSIEELLEERSILSKAMLLEKAKDNKEIVEILNKMLAQKMSKEEKEFLENALETFLKHKIGAEKAKELKDKINIKNGGDSMVIENLERIWDDTYNDGVKAGKALGLKTGIKTGIEQNKIEIAKRLLKRGMLLDEIQEITELSKDFIKKLK